MLPWSNNPDPPLSLILAADTRLYQTDYVDDHIWELRTGGEPPALALETTYGLRANRMRLFPRFLKPGGERTNPSSFHSPVRVRNYNPNYLSLSFAPYEGLEVTAEYWVPESQIVAGRIKVINQSVLPQSFRMELAALLNPRGREGGLVPLQTRLGYALSGETSNLQVILYLSSAAQSVTGPFPALGVDIEIYPGNSRSFQWVCAGQHSQEQSVEAVRRTLIHPWDASITRLEMQNRSDLVMVDSGNPDWDHALLVSQKLAHQLFLQNWPYMPAPSFVLTRRPDQGFSARGDGSDHPASWKGQTVFDSCYLASLLLPGSPHLVQGLIRNFLAFQNEQGRIDWRIGLGGQRTQRLAQPMLASLAILVAPYLEEKSWYTEVYPGLKRFFECWLSPEHDADGDGFPEWENPPQTALEDSPIYDRFSAHGVDASIIESPALAAMLIRECQSLIDMARCLSMNDDLPALEETLARLQAVLAETWDQSAGIYQYRDSQSHSSYSSTSVVSFQGSGSFTTRRRFKLPRRLVVSLQTHDERTYAVTFTIHGFTENGETSETLAARNFFWLSGRAYAATQATFLVVERVEVMGLTARDKVKIYTPDLAAEDISLLLPLWAGAPDIARARRLVETTVLKRFWQAHGIPVAPGQVDTISMPWNQLAGEGLLRYGYRAQAAELCTRLMNTVAYALKHHSSPYQYYQARSGQPLGERGHLHGLAPLSLFLQTLGIRQIHPRQILIDGFNPFSQTVTVQYRKILVKCCSDHTEIHFSSGQQIVIDRPGIHRVTLS